MEGRKMNSDKAHLRQVLYDSHYRRIDKNLTNVINVLQELLNYVRDINNDVTEKSGFVYPIKNLDFLANKLNEDINNMAIDVKHLHELYADIKKKEKKDEANKLNKSTK